MGKRKVKEVRIWGEFEYETERLRAKVVVQPGKDGLPEARCGIVDKTGRVR